MPSERAAATKKILREGLSAVDVYKRQSGNCYAAVYKGKKSQYPNYSLFVIDGGKPARRELLQGFDTPTEGEVLSLVPAGKSAGGIYGWDCLLYTSRCWAARPMPTM